MGFPGGSVVKNQPANSGDTGSIPGLGRSPGKRNGNQLQYSWLENPMDREAWRATVHGVTKESDTTEPLNNNLIMYHSSLISLSKTESLSSPEIFKLFWITAISSPWDRVMFFFSKPLLGILVCIDLPWYNLCLAFHDIVSNFPLFLFYPLSCILSTFWLESPSRFFCFIGPCPDSTEFRNWPIYILNS